MSSNHKRNVRGMHDAPRCQSLTEENRPCKNPAVRGKTRCQVHGGKGARSKNYRQESNDHRLAYLELESQVNMQTRHLGKVFRKIERSGASPDILDAMAKVRRGFHHLTKQKPSDLVAMYRPPEAEVIAKRQQAMALDMRRQYSASGHRSLEMIRDRARGAMIGLAVGEAVGLTLAGRERDSYRQIEDMWGGGFIGLKPGEWAGDTAMALALMDSLTFRHRMDEHDFMGRLVDWRDDGAYSCTGACVGLGRSTSEALARYERSGDPVAGETQAECIANDSLVRMAPVTIRYWRRHAELCEVAVRQSIVTHAGPFVVSACVGFAQILADAICGLPRDKVLEPREVHSSCSLRPLMVGEWKGKKRDDISGSNNALMTLEAALWCVGTTDNFEEAVLRAANLGEDAGSTAAAAGQLAGALYGACAVPFRWVEELAWHDKLVDMADLLFDQSLARG